MEQNPKAESLRKARYVITVRKQYEAAVDRDDNAERVRLARLLESLDRGLQTA